MAGINGFMLDTTALIDFLRGDAPTIKLLTKLVEEAPLAISPIQVGEIYSGLRPGDLGKIEELLESLVFYPISCAAAKKAGLLKKDYARKGINLSLADMLIAAVAMENALLLVTKNVKHFPMRDLPVIEH